MIKKKSFSGKKPLGSIFPGILMNEVETIESLKLRTQPSKQFQNQKS